LAGEDGYEGRVALHELLQAGKNIGDLVEAVEAFGAAAEFAGGLMAAQEEDADERCLGASKVEGFTEPVLILGHAAIGAAGTAREAEILKAVQGQADFFVIEMHYRFAVGELVAGVDECVERLRVVVGSGDFLFDKRPKDAGLRGGEMDGPFVDALRVGHGS
jgi:hypothetical protein